MTKYKTLANAAKSLGTAPVAPRVTVSFEDTINAAGIAQPACTRCGDCCGGCNVGAKNTVAATYLPDAARHGAEIFAGITVRHVEKTSGGSWRVHTVATMPSANGDAARVIIRAHRHSRRRHARLDGNPAALARTRPRRLGQAGHPLFRQRRHHCFWLWRQGARSTRSASGIPRRCRNSRSAPPSPARSRSTIQTISTTNSASRKARCPPRSRRRCR